MADATKNDGWVRLNHITHAYETKDGTSVAAELVEGVECLADVFRIADIREQQRAKAKEAANG